MPEQDAGKSIPEVVQELWDLVVGYFKQETIEPIKGLGRFLGYGIAGSLLLGLGLVLLALAGLRALQTEAADTFDGDWTWAPYAIVLAGAVILSVFFVSRISKKRSRS